MRKGAIISLLLLLCIASALAQRGHYPFVSISAKQGLSHNQVTDFLRDSKGFMWFGTLSGLNRYDGYTIRTFTNIPGDTTSILTNGIVRLFEGPDEKIWIYTHSGISIYDSKTERFHRNTNAIQRQYHLPTGVITFVQKDSDGNFWFIHYNQGIFRYTPQTREVVRLTTSPSAQSIASTNIASIVEDRDKNFWITHRDGTFEKLDHKTLKIVYRNAELKSLFRRVDLDFFATVDFDNDLWLYAANSNEGCYLFNSATGSIKAINKRSNPQLNSNIIRRVIHDGDRMIWIATDHGGINVIDKKTQAIEYVLHDPEDAKSVSENSINSLYRDHEGIIWVGTFKKGISYYHPDIFRFPLFTHHPDDNTSLPFNDINAFAEDSKGNLWIGTNGGGLIYFDRKSEKFTRYPHDPGNPNSLANNVIVSLLIDHRQELWIGTYYGGLDRFDGKRFQHYKHVPTDPKSLSDDNVWELKEDSKHNIWIGTLKAGADVFLRDKNEFLHYRSGDFNSIHTTYVPTIMEDREGNMWLGTGYGLEFLDITTGRFTHYLNSARDSASLSSNGVQALLEDSRGLIWVGTYGGLNLFDKGTRTFRAFTQKDGLPDNAVVSIVEDDEKNIWLATPNGLSRLSVGRDERGALTFSFRNYDERDGLQGKAFNDNAALKLSDGAVVFAGDGGFNIFSPEKIAISITKPPVLLTRLSVFNKDIAVDENVNDNVILEQSISTTAAITLEPANNVFSLEFAALNFFHPEKTQYQYMLEGFNKEWLTANSAQRTVTFTNLDPGDYTFKVRASNSDGIWNDKPTLLKITILPPFWRSQLAFVLYSFIILGGLVLARWIILTKERMTNRMEEERKEAQRMHELDMMKIKFFTNISHEFRTPLTLILAPIEKLISQAEDDEQKNQYQLIQRNAKRLLNMVNQLLDFRNVEAQEIRFTPSEGDIVGFVRDLVYSFSDLSEKKHIRFSFQTAVQEHHSLFDQDKVEKIIFNLLSNAFKFTPENGSVTVELGLKPGDISTWVEIRVIDSGIGIAKEKHERIFERFYQDNIPASLVNQGSGIGLSIVKEFVRVHGGVIKVESEPGRGSCFSILLPAPALEVVHAPDEAPLQELIHEGALEDGEVAATKERKPVVLLVEDNEDFRVYLKDSLRGQYSILEAANGKTALQKALATLPDLIVSDVMMPEMDGIALCKSLRSDSRTSHIPVILLTARTSEQQKLEGFETGANDYITKPFNFEILSSRIKNLLMQRERYQKVLQKHVDVRATEIPITSLDEKLIQTAIQMVEKHMADPEFSVEELSRELAMSRVHLYKKLLALTGKSPMDFIRTIRLQRAAQLLEKSQLTVAEVAYQVGFNNPKYFTKYFKEQFQVLPSAYASGKRVDA